MPIAIDSGLVWPKKGAKRSGTITFRFGEAIPPGLPREEIDKIDYKNVTLLQRFITERGKLRSRRVTGLSRRDQSKMARAVKRSRELGLLPYVDATKGLERSGGRGRSRD